MDTACAACPGGQTWWPCNDASCFCWEAGQPRAPPAPSSGLAVATAKPCDVFTEAMFNNLAASARAPYTYAGLCRAIEGYNSNHKEKVFGMGTRAQQAAELAAFLGNTLHEAADFTAPREYTPCGDTETINGEVFCKPCTSGAYDYGTHTCKQSTLEGGGQYTFGCSPSRSPPSACACSYQSGGSGTEAGRFNAEKGFFGRGAIQLTHDYNYIAASIALTGSPDTFCNNPDLVATNETYAWGAGIWFWMENLMPNSAGSRSTCHIEASKGANFGDTLNNINGGLECPAAPAFGAASYHERAVAMRINRYCRAATVMGLPSLLSFSGCDGMQAAFDDCTGSNSRLGACDDCMVWAQAEGVTERSFPGFDPSPDGFNTTPDPEPAANPDADIDPAPVPTTTVPAPATTGLGGTPTLLPRLPRAGAKWRGHDGQSGPRGITGALPRFPRGIQGGTQRAFPGASQEHPRSPAFSNSLSNRFNRFNRFPNGFVGNGYTAFNGNTNAGFNGRITAPRNFG